MRCPVPGNVAQKFHIIIALVQQLYNCSECESYASAADLKCLHQPAANSARNFKSKSGTRIIEFLVPLGFRSSCQSVLRCITNFGNGALVRKRERENEG